MRQTAFQQNMQASGYTREEVTKLRKDMRMDKNSADVSLMRSHDLLDFVDCKCSEIGYECHVCKLNRLRREYNYIKFERV